MSAAKIHRRYYDARKRPDLRALAKCNNISGPICDAAHLTSDVAKVTCGRCLRIMGAVPSPNAPPHSPADLRLNSRLIGPVSPYLSIRGPR